MSYENYDGDWYPPKNLFDGYQSQFQIPERFAVETVDASTIKTFSRKNLLNDKRYLDIVDSDNNRYFTSSVIRPILHVTRPREDIEHFGSIHISTTYEAYRANFVFETEDFLPIYNSGKRIDKIIFYDGINSAFELQECYIGDIDMSCTVDRKTLFNVHIDIYKFIKLKVVD